MSLVKAFNEEENKYISLMVNLHIYTKKYLIIAEEVAEKGELFLQPLKEHRDAFDHLMRCYCVSLSDDEEIIDDDKELYIQKNLSKAFGHVYRAFFDTADWLTYILRHWIRIKLESVGNEICEQKFYNYSEIKEIINNIPLKVAALRVSKDVGKIDNQQENILIEEIDAYIEILETLIKLRKNVIEVLGL